MSPAGGGAPSPLTDAAPAAGRDRRRILVLLSGALGVAAGYQIIVGAIAPELKVAMAIDNTQVGLLITATSLMGAATTLPFGLLADRMNRVRLLAVCVLAWTAAILLAGTAQSYGVMLAALILLGAGIGAATPVVASLTGDLFPASERGRAYGLILAGEFAGAAIALVVAGQLAAWWTWRGAFWVLAVPGPVLAFALLTLLKEPERGAMERLPGSPGAPDRADSAAEHDLFVLVEKAQIRPHPRMVLAEDPARKSLWWALRYVLSIRTNVLIVVASALVYYYVAGMQAFIVVFLRDRFDIGQSSATLLLVAIGVSVVAGTLVTGPLSDRLIRRGYIPSRPVVGGLACLFVVLVTVPGMILPVMAVAFPLLCLGSAGMGALNPPLDAARLDIMHSRLWGRAEAVRNFVQALIKSSAPLLFGFLSTVLSTTGPDVAQAQGSGDDGLTRAFLVMLVIVLAAALMLLVAARRSYPRDVATAMASEAATRRT